MSFMSGANSGSAAVPSLPIQQYLEVAVYLLALTGFATLASTGGLDLPGILFVSSALLIRGYLLASGQTLVINSGWTTLLTVGYAIYYLADYFFISRSFISATVHLVLFVMVVRLFSAQRARDYYFLAVISFLMVLAAAVLTVDSVFLVTFAFFMLTAVASVVLMEMNHASGRAPSQPKPDASTPRLLTFSLARISQVMVLLILGGAAGIFFVLPRVSAGYLHALAPRNQYIVGFSDQVQLGGIGEIQQSSAVVMHVGVDGDQHGRFSLKWRGVYLNSFDGKSWSGFRAQHAAPLLATGDFVVAPPDAAWLTPAAAAPGRDRIHYHVLMEPIGTSVFFLAPRPLELRGNYRVVGMDGSGAVFDLDPDRPVARYEAWSDITPPAAAELRLASSPYPPEVGAIYLQVPELDPRIAALARQITANLHNNYDRAAAVESYLRTHFGYTLQLPRSVPDDPLANFLFERKQGHCEYFASAMAIMLRDIGIASRLVNGFRTGEFNDLTSQYVIRASDAHSWVEAYFPGYGWVSFDPTPSRAAGAPTGWGRVALYLDAARSFWREWVVNYDVSHQQTLGEATARNTRQRFLALRRWYRSRYARLLFGAGRIEKKISASPLRWAALALVAMALVILAARARRLWLWVLKRRLAAHPEQSPSLAAAVWYERMTRTLARRGWRKSPLQTPQEFLQSISEPGLRARVEEFTWHYEEARFGDVAEDAHRLSELYEEVSAASRNRAGIS
jgi:protein-glutamine gamma-glutamyltransferase